MMQTKKPHIIWPDPVWIHSKRKSGIYVGAGAEVVKVGSI